MLLTSGRPVKAETAHRLPLNKPGRPFIGCLKGRSAQFVKNEQLPNKSEYFLTNAVLTYRLPLNKSGRGMSRAIFSSVSSKSVGDTLCIGEHFWAGWREKGRFKAASDLFSGCL